jgi:rhodanese-related sulfurtransferase
MNVHNRGGQRLKALVLESLLLALAGLGLALLANQLSPRGLALTRNYFPPPVKPPPGNGSTGIGTNASPKSPDKIVEDRIRQRGFQIVGSDDVAQLYRDPRHAQGLVVFVDARDDAHYRAGHIPGALQFDYYRREQYLPQVLPACLAAEKTVVYCTGGDCEDSEFAAVALSEAGVPKDRLFIYLGGFSEWATHGLPVELGERHSGQLRNPPK